MIGKVGGWGQNPQKSGSFRRGNSMEAEKAADFKRWSVKSILR